jgi:hypothetical protein
MIRATGFPKFEGREREIGLGTALFSSLSGFASMSIANSFNKPSANSTSFDAPIPNVQIVQTTYTSRTYCLRMFARQERFEMKKVLARSLDTLVESADECLALAEGLKRSAEKQHQSASVQHENAITLKEISKTLIADADQLREDLELKPKSKPRLPL